MEDIEVDIGHNDEIAYGSDNAQNPEPRADVDYQGRQGSLLCKHGAHSARESAPLGAKDSDDGVSALQYHIIAKMATAMFYCRA